MEFSVQASACLDEGTFNYSDVIAGIGRDDIATRMKERGYLVIHLDCLSDEETHAMQSWENVFREAFARLRETGTESGAAEASPSPYRSEHGATLGYRKDDTREFFETRRSFDGRIDPTSSAPTYDVLVLALFRLLGAVGREVARCMSDQLGMGTDYFTQLMDAELIPEADHFSSAVLRVCNYMPGGHDTSTNVGSPDIAFGSHTDTSFVTVAPVSSNNGLEIMDLFDGSWHMVEVGAKQPAVVVFTGECSQMLTKSYYRAAVHRVRTTGINNRISCPLIMRGRKRALLPKIDGDILDRIPDKKRKFFADLDGTSMSLIHKMLDFKRLKCREQNKENSGDWVLAAYPIVIGQISETVTVHDAL